MDSVIQGAARLVRAARNAWGSKWLFGILAVLIFSASFGVLAQLDLLPELAPAAPQNTPIVEGATEANDTAESSELPVKIEAPEIGLSAQIVNPKSTAIPTLDEALLKGAVRYPTSALLGENGTVVLFGHSSYLPIVHNQAYKTFDDIQKLHAGDAIMVYSSDRVYTYQVKSVMKENAASGAIPLAATGRILTLATCDSFGTKSDRFVVTAEFVESHSVTAS